MPKFDKEYMQGLQGRVQNRFDTQDLRFAFFDVREGTSIIRWGPPWSGDVVRDDFYFGGSGVLVYKHNNLPNGDFGIVCLSRTYKEAGIPCDLCMVLHDATEATVPLGNHYVQARAHTNWLDRADGQARWKIGNIPYKVFKWFELLGFETICKATDPVGGTDISVVRTGTGLKTDYASSFVPAGPSPLHPDKEVVKQMSEPMGPDNPIGLIDISRVFPKTPKDAVIGKVKEAAAKLRADLQIGSASRAQLQVPGIPGQQPVSPPPAAAPQGIPGQPTSPQPSSPPPSTPPPAAQPVEAEQQGGPEEEQFESSWLTTLCSVCGQPQYTTPTGHSCPSGDVNAPAKTQGPPAQPVASQAQAPPETTPPPPSVATEVKKSSGKAKKRAAPDALKPYLSKQSTQEMVDVPGKGNRPSCISLIPGNIHLNYPPLLALRENQGDTGCVTCAFEPECSEQTLAVNGPTPGGKA